MSISAMKDVAKSNERGGERQLDGIADLKVDAQRIGMFLCLGVPDERRRDVDGMHLCAKPGELPGVGALAAAYVQAGKPGDRREHCEEGWGIQGIAIHVISGAGMPGPGVGVGFPMSGDLLAIHRWFHLLSNGLSAMRADVRTHGSCQPPCATLATQIAGRRKGRLLPALETRADVFHRFADTAAQDVDQLAAGFLDDFRDFAGVLDGRFE